MAAQLMQSTRQTTRGFTLIEVMVAISVMALMSLMAWRGLDGMLRTQSSLQIRADEVRTLQAGLAQWQTDLDQLAELPGTPSWDWNGQVLRLTRRSADVPPPGGDLSDNLSGNFSNDLNSNFNAPSTEPSSAIGSSPGTSSNTVSGTASTAMRTANRPFNPVPASVRVVAWTWRSDPGRPGGGDWQRWQSPPLSQRQDWQSAWALAAQWGQTPDTRTRAGQIQIHPLSGWQLFVHRGGSWANPLSSDAVTADAAGAAGAAGSASAGQNTVPNTPPIATTPDGVRLVLSLPPGPVGAGTLTLDWVRPTLSGAPS